MDNVKKGVIGPVHPDHRVPPVKQIIRGHLEIPVGHFLHPVLEIRRMLNDGVNPQVSQEDVTQTFANLSVHL